ncbi:MAG TPA: hypothetical protein VGW35_06690 [Methylomirabilota bacterium]|jgi:hypothetical protein|nr:hypothetical protein [Methylomirabilota bacterium]
MRALVIAILLPLVLAGPALGFQCPLLIKQLNDEVARLSPDDPKVKRAKSLIEEARQRHAEGSHAKSIAAADEAAKVLGIELKKN